LKVILEDGYYFMSVCAVTWHSRQMIDLVASHHPVFQLSAQHILFSLEKD